MKLQDIFDQLSAGEFSQLSMGGAPAGVIDDSNYGRVLNHVNLGLTALFSRFTLKKGQLALSLQPGQTHYKLTSAYAVNARRSKEPVRYILDTAADPFMDDVIKVEQVWTDQGVELGLNDANDPMAVSTPSALVLRVPEGLTFETLTVDYRATHPKLVVSMGYFDPTRIPVQLPQTHLEALLFYVASRVNNPIGMTGEFHAGNSYYARYEQACQWLEGKGLQVDQGGSNDRLRRNGWV